MKIFKKSLLAAAVCVLLAFCLVSCGGDKQETAANEDTEPETQVTAANTDEAVSSEVTSAGETGTSEEGSDGTAAGSRSHDFEESLTASEAEGNEIPYYGIMHAAVLDINGSGDSNTIYTFSDINDPDPDNGWSFSRLEILDIETVITAGEKVSIIFNGDPVNDYENVSFLVVLPYADYELRRAEGVTVSNLMSTFTIETDAGQDISFLKDNCKTDEGALSADSGDRVIVYYADDGEGGCYPMRVFKAS